jgi:hypothetical protein
MIVKKYNPKWKSRSEISFESWRNRSTIVECEICGVKQGEYCYGIHTFNAPACYVRLKKMYRMLQPLKTKITL